MHNLQILRVIQRKYHRELWSKLLSVSTGWTVPETISKSASQYRIHTLRRSVQEPRALLYERLTDPVFCFSSFTGAPKNPGEGLGELSEKAYNEIADHSLEELTAFFEELGDTTPCHPEYDVMLANGVLTVKLKPGETFVINKQSPNKQIWLSSPYSGPKRYDYVQGSWVYLHNGESLYDLLSAEVSKSLGASIDFSQCVPSSTGK